MGLFLNKKISFLFLLCIMSVTIIAAQAPRRATAADIHDDLKRLNVLASALFVAAHPDDENTRMISWLSNKVRARTAYLSLTRGDGGQNLIGTELAELLGVLRTQELLMARSVDGGQQFFTRATDFGYSKHPDETLKIWNKDEVLSDVVWTIRKFQPDIIINRFDHKSAGRTHGHHTSSAVLSYEAFDLAGDANAYSEQLKYLNTWQPTRLFFNTSWWFYGSRENFAKADKTNLSSVDVGAYYPLQGKSNNEIAAESRSMHKCQGMGSTPSRGSLQEYLEFLKGEKPTGKEDPFSGINTTWTRLKGGAPIGDLITKVEKEFDYENPQTSVPDLVKAYKMIQALPDGYWKEVKLTDIRQSIYDCLGLFLDATTAEYSATPGQDMELEIEAITRTGGNVKLKSVNYLPIGVDTILNIDLEGNEAVMFNTKINFPANLAVTNPYWLNEKGSYGMYKVTDQQMIGQPETPRNLQVRFELEIENEPFTFYRDMVYKKTDPVKGEVYRPFEITPPVFTNVVDPVYVFPDQEGRPVEILVKAGRDDLKGILKLAHPKTWKISPESIDFNLAQKGEEQTFTFTVFPPEGQDVGVISPMAQVNGKSYSKGVNIIDYDHVPTQTVFQNAESKVVKIDLKKAGDRIGYIMGAGDNIPESLEQIGYRVDLLEDKDIRSDNLQKYDAVIIGIRALNTNERIKFQQSTLMEYLEKGGTVIVQYNTAHRLKTKEFSPYPIKLSRKRVSDENAEVRLLKPDHPVLNYPNKITSKDFEGWVQERGLYFPDEWDEKYDTILSSNDLGEDPNDGGLLVGKYGEGHFIYSGYSWFRELPAGVPGAYRLFTNLISIGK